MVSGDILNVRCYEEEEESPPSRVELALPSVNTCLLLSSIVCLVFL